MSWNPLQEPSFPDVVGMDSIETLIVPRSVDVNPFIRRVLPAPQRQMVGPFIFFDQFGPLEIVISAAGDVRPHPHIGLATVTYLYQGEIHHRDSLGRARSSPLEPSTGWWRGAASPIPNARQRRTSDDRLPSMDFRLGSRCPKAARTRRQASNTIRRTLSRSSRQRGSAFG